MRRGILFFACLVLISFVAQGQVIWVEHFSYSTFPDNVNWAVHSGTTNPLVLSGSLSYPGYMPGQGNRVEISQSRDADVSRYIGSFSQPSEGSYGIYCSFLMKVTSDPSTTGDYFFHFMGGGGGYHGGRLYIKRGTNSGKFVLGLRKVAGSAISWMSSELDAGQVYLIVVKYEFHPETNDDVVKLWVNPNLSGSEPAPSLTHSDAIRYDYYTSAPPDNIMQYVALRQNNNPGMGTIEIDEMRVGLSWGDAPLPVQVSNIVGEAMGRSVKIRIETQTEDADFVGFNIYRRFEGEEFKVVGSYERDENLRSRGGGGFGNVYEFVDEVEVAGVYYYRVEAVSLSGRGFVGEELKVFVMAPERFSLYQNYPNPFNPGTEIGFDLPKEVYVKLVVYDVLGREVAVLVDGEMKPGYHRVRFDGGGLASGVYYYRLVAGNFVDVKKMVLMK